MAKKHTPNARDFVQRASFRAVRSPTGVYALEARLDNTLYDVTPYGDDAVQIVTKGEDPQPVATLTMRDGKFVLAG